ncbi:hypothetical protein ACFSJ3_08585 [Corallincola platygyrae]|uniref:Uncharacterized protein n=1 Tax=Corallincola platygyrae TaxID=1193278 RepID=A0ABW4XNJ1_9GAMM
MKRFDLDKISTFVIVITFVLFALALFATGFTKELLLETGVFLVSVKLIIMAHKDNLTNQQMMRELAEIKAKLDEPEPVSDMRQCA